MSSIIKVAIFLFPTVVITCSFFLIFHFTDSYLISGIFAGVLLFLLDKYAFFLVNQLPIFLQKPFYQSYKQRVLAVTKAGSPLLAYPMSIFIELTLDKVFKEKGFQAAIEAMHKQVGKMSADYDKFFDEVDKLDSSYNNFYDGKIEPIASDYQKWLDVFGTSKVDHNDSEVVNPLGFQDFAKAVTKLDSEDLEKMIQPDKKEVHDSHYNLNRLEKIIIQYS